MKAKGHQMTDAITWLSETWQLCFQNHLTQATRSHQAAEQLTYMEHHKQGTCFPVFKLPKLKFVHILKKSNPHNPN